MRNLVLFIATGAGTGYLPVAPGTFGSALGVVLWAGLAAISSPASLGYAAATLAVTGVGVWAADRAEQILGLKDDGRITVDEVAGQLIALAFLPLSIGVGAAGFVLFRLFDILKPPPVRALEALPGGLGVMLDDVLAGIYANLAGQLLWRVLVPAVLA
ncbi:MAG: phosphatidylglycerophosphatase A [Myxococcota bacterium]